MSDNDFHTRHVTAQIAIMDKQVRCGAAVLSRKARTSMEDPVSYSLEVFDFLDSEQLSNMDAFLLHLGKVDLYLSDELEDTSKGMGKRVASILQHKQDIEIHFLKKSVMTKKAETSTLLSNLVDKPSHATNTVEVQSPMAFGVLDALLSQAKLSPKIASHGTVDEEYLGKFSFSIGALSTIMRLDSAAADAVHLLPKSDQPSKFGSIFGVLNRGVTKMGSRLLERWLRQPLVDHIEINKRLDLVSILKDNAQCRTALCEALKKCPDVEMIIGKMSRRNAGLAEIYRLYIFAKILPVVCESLKACVDEAETSADVSQAQSLKGKLLDPLLILVEKFDMYMKLVEHVIDFSQLPDLVVNAELNEELRELHQEKGSVQAQAEEILEDARCNWASFADVKLEKSNVHAFFLRSAKGDDERQLRANNKAVKILSIQKNGVHFTTKDLEALSERSAEIDEEYSVQQRDVVEKAVETAATYLPLAEAASALIAELDVVTGFALAAVLSAQEYCRPAVLPQGGGIIDLKGARHPCVELMDSVDFISNDYSLQRDSSAFQVVTGPNMGGKSTYIRGVGAIVTMAQVGAFVPCESATLSVVDSILARVGAGDAVSKGVSTFMAEMLEAAVILQTSTSDSLIIIDELGRGTSTFDGFGIAWAISEYMITQKKCLCLFATHFHELTALARQFPAVVNKHVSAITQDNQVVMLYQVKDGPCDQSFGIHIAATADFPQEVIQVAKRKAAELEHVGTDSTSEEGQKKHKHVTESLEKFGSLEPKSMDRSSFVGAVGAIFAVTP